MSNQVKAYVLTSMVITFWATAATAFKIALRYVSPCTLLLYSTLSSTLILFFILLWQRKLSLLRGIRAGNIVGAMILGFLNPFLYYVVLFEAYDVLPGQIAMSLNYGWPLVLTLLSVPILQQSLTRSQLGAVLISFVGAVIIATKGEFTSFGNVSRMGVVLAGGSTLIWATFWLFNAREKQDPVLKLFLGFCFGLSYTTMYSLMTQGIVLPDIRAWFPLVYVGLFEMGITFVLWLTALQLTTAAARIGNLIYITPFFSLVILRLVIGEHIHPATFLGLILIVGSIIFQGIMAKKKKGK